MPVTLMLINTSGYFHHRFGWKEQGKEADISFNFLPNFRTACYTGVSLVI